MFCLEVFLLWLYVNDLYYLPLCCKPRLTANLKRKQLRLPTREVKKWGLLPSHHVATSLKRIFVTFIGWQKYQALLKKSHQGHKNGVQLNLTARAQQVCSSSVITWAAKKATKDESSCHLCVWGGTMVRQIFNFRLKEINYLESLFSWIKFLPAKN